MLVTCQKSPPQFPHFVKCSLHGVHKMKIVCHSPLALKLILGTACRTLGYIWQDLNFSCKFLDKKLWNSRIGPYVRDQNWSARMLWHFGIQPFTMCCYVWIVWCQRVNKIFVWWSFTYSSVQWTLGECQCIIWFGFHIKWDLYLSNMNWREIFWAPNFTSSLHEGVCEHTL